MNSLRKLILTSPHDDFLECDGHHRAYRNFVVHLLTFHLENVSNSEIVKMYPQSYF